MPDLHDLIGKLRADVATERLRSDLLFAGFERGEEEIDGGDQRRRRIVTAGSALLDVVEAAAVVSDDEDGACPPQCEAPGDGGCPYCELRAALDALREAMEAKG